MESILNQSHLVRLDKKTGERILCHSLDCGLELAVIRADYHVEGSWDGRPALLISRWVEFSPGWVQHDDGIWRFSDYAVKRVKQGKEPKVRSYPKLEEGFIVSREHILTSVPQLPADVICWQRRLLNRIDMAALGIEAVALNRFLD